MMSKYEVVERYYAAGIWDDRKVRDAVKKGWISEEEYERITEKSREV